MRVRVLTISDRCAAGEAEDASGPGLRDIVTTKLNAECLGIDVLPDDDAAVERWLREHCDADDAPDLILTTGGTGLAPRDVTPEATERVLHRRCPGVMELMRLRCLDKTPLAFLSRGVAGTRERTLIINLPGSPRGSRECLEAVIDLLEHAVAVLRDDDVDQTHQKMQDAP